MSDEDTSLGNQIALARKLLRKRSESGRSQFLLHFHIAGGERDRCVADLADYRMGASIGKVGQVPGPELA